MPNNLFCICSSHLFFMLEFLLPPTYFLERTQRTQNFEIWLMTLISTLSSYAGALLKARNNRQSPGREIVKLSIRITAQWEATNGSWGSVGNSQSLSQLSCRRAWLATSSQQRVSGFPV